MRSRDEIINSWITVIFFAWIVSFPPAIYFFLRYKKPYLKDEDFKARFESLYLNVNIDDDKSIKLMAMFVFRRMVYAMNIVFLQGSTVA